MKNSNNRVYNSSKINFLVPIPILMEKIKFSHPQSSILILGNHELVHQTHSLVNQLFNQFNYLLYIIDEENYYVDFDCQLYRMEHVSILEGGMDSNILLNLFQDYKCLTLSVEGMSKRLRNKFWNLLSMNIRMFIIKRKVLYPPNLIVSFDHNLTVLDPTFFEYFRILGLWGDEYGLRFNLYLDSHEKLAFPARSLFGIYALLPGVSTQEVVQIISKLPIANQTKNDLYNQYLRMDQDQVLFISPSGIFDPMLIKLNTTD